MKRWLSLALVLALLCAALPCAAMAEPVDPEAESANVVLAAPGLTIEETDDPSDEPSANEEEPADALETFDVRYGRVAAESAAVYADAETETAFAAIPAGSTVLMVGASLGRVKAAFFTGEVIVEGYVEAAALAELTDDEISAYMDAAANGGPVALYDDDLARPLVPVTCAFAAPAGDDDETGDTDAGDNDDTDADDNHDNDDNDNDDVDEPAGPAVLGAADADGDDNDDNDDNDSDDAGEFSDGAGLQAAAAPVATGIRISRASIAIGQKETYTGLRLIPEPEGSVLPEGITWRSKNSKVVVVNDQGHIYGRKTGSTTIYASLPDGTETACQVTVKYAPGILYISSKTLELSEGGMAAQLTASTSKKAASGQIAFTSSDPAVAEVSETGLVTALKAGTATITARTYNGHTATCQVRVYAAPASAAFAEESLKIGEGQKTALIVTARDADGNIVPAGVTFAIDPTTNDPGCVAVDAATGALTGLRKGQAVVMVTTHNGVVARCTVNVVAAPAAIALNATAINIGKKELYTGFAVTLTPGEGEDDCAAGLIWSTSNRKIVAVNQKGEIYGKKAGSAYIYVTTHNGKKARCKVTVKAAPGRVYISPASLTMSAGGMLALLKTSVPKKTAAGQITFTSSDPGVATVSEDGLVTALTPGTATITARSYNGRAASCKVRVLAEPASVAFPEESVNIGVGQALQAEPSAQDADGGAVPANYTYSVDATSSDPDCISVDPATGVVTGIYKGQAVVVATTHNGVAGSFTVNVLAAPGMVSLNRTALTIGKKELFTGFTVALTPPSGESECAGQITWKSSNSRVVSVNQKGQIYGRNTGTAYVYAVAHNGKWARCKVVVRRTPTKIAISPVKAYLKTGASGQYRVKMNSGAGGTITWTSSDESIAVVDAGGKVTALKSGTVTITATTYNGKSAKSTLRVSATGSSMPAVESTTTTYDPSMSNQEKLEYVIWVAQSKLGKPYTSNTSRNKGPDSFDCSGFTYYCFKQIGVKLSASALTQGNDLHYAKIRNISDLRRGDLVFFDTNETDGRNAINHAGLYLGNGYFIHASSSAGKVIISQFRSSTSNFYQRTFWWGYRVLN